MKDTPKKDKPKNESNNFTFDLEGDFDESSEEKPSKLDNKTTREESSEEEMEVINLISKLNPNKGINNKRIAITNSKSAPKENVKEDSETLDSSRYFGTSVNTGLKMQRGSLLDRVKESLNSLQENQK